MAADNTLKLVDETLRDGTQSLWGMMMSYHMFEPVIGEIAQAGFDTISLPVHVAQVLISTRFFKEDPRYLFRMFKHKLKHTRSNVMTVGLGASLDVSAAAECAKRASGYALLSGIHGQPVLRLPAGQADYDGRYSR